MTEYTPSDAELARAWKHYRDSMDAADAWVREDDAEPAEDEAYRAISRIKAEALEDLAQLHDLEAQRLLAEGKHGGYAVYAIAAEEARTHAQEFLS